MRYIGRDEIRSCLTFDKLIAAIEDAHRRPRMEVDEAFLGEEGGHYFVRHAVDRGRYMASKLITSFPENPRKGKLPAVQAIAVLFDGTDGRPLAALDGTEITYWRTAADSALGAKLLARTAPKTMLVVGAGEMSRWLVRAHHVAHPSIERVLIWNRSPERAAAAAAELGQEGYAVEAVGDLDGAVGACELITTCTRSHTPLIKGDLLQPGTHVDLVGGYTEATRESDDATVKRARLFVDLRESAFSGVGDILDPIARGVIGAGDVLGDLYDLVGGKVAGRLSPDDITVFKNAGGGHFDLIASQVVWSSL